MDTSMYVTIPNADNYQFHRGLFIAAWKVWFKRFSDDPDNWQEGRMPVTESDHSLASLLSEGHRFSLEVICRLMVPWNYRNLAMADSHFLHMNTDLLRPVSYRTDTGSTVPGVRLADQSLDMWEEFTFNEQDTFMILPYVPSTSEVSLCSLFGKDYHIYSHLYRSYTLQPVIDFWFCIWILM